MEICDHRSASKAPTGLLKIILITDDQIDPDSGKMMQSMRLIYPAPIQSRLKHLQEKEYISFQEVKARTIQIVDEIIERELIMNSVAAGGLI